MRKLLIVGIIVTTGIGYFFYKPDIDQFFHVRKMKQLEILHAEARKEAEILREKISADPSVLSECPVTDKTIRTQSLADSDGGTRANLDRTNTIKALPDRVLIQAEAKASKSGSVALRIEEINFDDYAPAKGTPLVNYFASSMSHRLTCYDIGRLGDASCKVVSNIAIPEVSEKCARQMIEKTQF